MQSNRGQHLPQERDALDGTLTANGYPKDCPMKDNTDASSLSCWVPTTIAKRWRRTFKQPEDEEAHAPGSWFVTRCATRSEAARKKDEAEAGKLNFVPGKGSSISLPGKPAVDALLFEVDGVYSEASSRGLFGKIIRERDYCHYRLAGCKGTNDRAVSISTVDAYDALRKELPAGTVIRDGDLGENLILSGPAWPEDAKAGLAVGTKLQFFLDSDSGDRPDEQDIVEIEITQANKPCYRMQYLPWADVAAKHWPKRKDGKWWKDKNCPLSKPGGRGWLAKVTVTGKVSPGYKCRVSGAVAQTV